MIVKRSFVVKATRAALLCGVCLSAPVLAQTTQTAQAPAAADSGNAGSSTIEDIIVTARFRKEVLQDTPLSISAFNAKTIQNSVVTDVTSVQKFLPNVQLGRVNFAGNSLAASIRGISFGDLEKTFDPAIGVAIDGVFLGTSTGGNVDFSDLESVEVLRGPQGTLYGRNTIGGTISLRHTRPTGELGAKMHVRYGSFNTVDVDGVVNLPKIADMFSIKLFGLRRTSDSFTRDRYTGKREKGRNYYDVGGSVLVDLGPETTLLASVDYQKDRSVYSSLVNLTKANGLPFGAGGTICDFTMQIGLGDLGCESQGAVKQATEGFKLANTTIPFQSYLDGWSSSAELNSKIGDFNLTAITGYRNTTDSLLEENTGAPPVPVAPGVTLPLFVAARDQDYWQFSQEIRIQGDLTDWMDIVAGAYYLHTNYKIRPYAYNGATNGTAFLLNTPVQSFTASQILDSYAVFAESIFRLGSKVRLTVGGRYTTETKKFNINVTVPAPGFTAAAQKTFSDPTGRVILDYKPVDGVMLYTSWSRGFRSGGFNGRATTATSIGPYDPERVDSYEAGMKADLFGGLLRFNPTIFQAEYTNKQEEVLRASGVGIGTETVVQNAASARIRGAELEIQARPMKELTLRAAGGYTDAKYKSFLVPDLANPGQTIDIASDRNFRRAPKYTFNAGADYLREIGGGNSINLTIDYAYIDHYTTSPVPDPTGEQRDTVKSRGTVDASVAFIHEGDSVKKLRVSAYVRDLFHGGGRINNTLDAGLFYFGTVLPNRELGVEATIAF